MQILLIAFLLYFFYKFVFGFLIPVIKTAGQVKKQFNAMKNQMGGNGDDANESQNNRSTSTSMPNNFTDSLKKRSTSGKIGNREDYIDFEEIPKN